MLALTLVFFQNFNIFSMQVSGYVLLNAGETETSDG